MIENIALVLVGILILAMAFCVSVLSKALVRMNERLLVLLGTRDGGAEVGRALVAAQRPPAGNLPGVAKEEPKVGVTMTMGAL